MTSPLSQFANARILFKKSGTRLSGRDGYTRPEGQAFLVQAFLKRRHIPGVLDDRLGLPAINGLPLEWAGYTISYAELTSAQADVFDQIDLSGLTFDTSTHLPPGVRRDSPCTLYVPGLELMSMRFSDTAGKFGQDGIGEIIRGVLGDPIYLDGGQIG